MKNNNENGQLHTAKAMIIDMDGVLWRGPEPIGDLLLFSNELSKKD